MWSQSLQGLIAVEACYGHTHLALLLAKKLKKNLAAWGQEF